MRVLQGNILEEVTKGVILQQVNAQGVMGSGIAKAIRDKWPVVWDEYHEWCPPEPTAAESLARLGKTLLVEVEDGLFVANIVGQQFYGRHEPRHAPRYTSYDAIDRSLTELAGVLRGLPVSLNFPLLGSDRGGGHWPIVKEIIRHRLAGFDQTLWLLPGVQEPT
jgi:O-acetyl-ADP-ribose deacetylase (regulator of RNase III)